VHIDLPAGQPNLVGASLLVGTSWSQAGIVTELEVTQVRVIIHENNVSIHCNSEGNVLANYLCTLQLQDFLNLQRVNVFEEPLNTSLQQLP